MRKRIKCGAFLRNPCLPCSRVVAVKRRPRDLLLWDTNCPMAQPQPLRPATALVRGHTFPGLLLDRDRALRGPARWQTPPARTLAQGPPIGLANFSANRLRPEIVRTLASSCPLLHGAAVVRSEGSLSFLLSPPGSHGLPSARLLHIYSRPGTCFSEDLN